MSKSTKLPFQEGDTLEYVNQEQPMKMTVRTIFESLGWMLVDNGTVGSKWEKLMIGDVLDRIKDGRFTVVKSQ